MRNTELDWLFAPIPSPDRQFQQMALQRQTELTKPPGSLGVLEEIAIRLAALQRCEKPSIDRIWVSVFAADHGIAAESVSAFSQVVTTEMVKNFAHGGAAVNVLSRYVQADFEVVDVGLLAPPLDTGIVSARVGNGTANFIHQPAMTVTQLIQALAVGRVAADRAANQGADVFIGGEMGIGNTTSASAIAAALLKIDPEHLSGAGTGLNPGQIEHKTHIIRTALTRHRASLDSPLGILQVLGGFEIAALSGAFIYAAQQSMPVLVDGFIATVAALCANACNASLKDWLFFAHCSHERGHRRVLQSMDVRPMLDLLMRLGEGSGALVAVPILQMACRLHNEMATFAEAKVTSTNQSKVKN